MQDNRHFYVELLPFSLQVPVPVNDLSQKEDSEKDEDEDEGGGELVLAEVVAAKVEEVSDHAHCYLEEDADSEARSLLLLQHNLVLLLHHEYYKKPQQTNTTKQ